MGATNRLDEWRGVLWGAPRAAKIELGRLRYLASDHRDGVAIYSGLYSIGQHAPRSSADFGFRVVSQGKGFFNWALGPSRGGCRWADRPPSVAGHNDETGY